jgi:UPF0176 protein
MFRNSLGGALLSLLFNRMTLRAGEAPVTCNRMKQELRNLVDRKKLLERMQTDGEDRTTVSFYCYSRIANPRFFRDYLFIHWESFGVLGRIYLAYEGINAQMSVPTDRFDEFKAHLYSILFLDNVRLNVAVDDGNSFFRLTIKVREKIVADGLEDDTFDVRDSGVHLDAKGFNELTSKEGTILIDMRNHYESEVGKFKGAITPDSDTFRDEIVIVEELLKGKEDQNIVMYCTGGIRCEKASAWLKHKGFPMVHQLEGGIIEYTRQVRDQGLENRFIGKNFVFDERRAERISPDVISQCHQCGEPNDDHTNCLNVGCNLLFIQCESCAKLYEGTCGTSCNEIVQLSEEEQKALRKGRKNSARIFNKARLRDWMQVESDQSGKSRVIGVKARRDDSK